MRTDVDLSGYTRRGYIPHMKLNSIERAVVNNPVALFVGAAHKI